MSFRWCRQIIALDNYAQVFGEECSPDVLDEIRSAVLDNTEIADYIDACGNDSYLLGQIRMALREGVSREYLDTRLTGRTIYNIRQGIQRGVNMQSLMWYATPKALRVDKKIVEVLSEFVLLGTQIERVDFTKVPTALVSIFCKGLYKGFPMWLLNDEATGLNEAQVRVLMRGMELGIDIHPFVSGGWDRNVLLMLFSYNKAVDINAILGYLTEKFSVNQVKTLLDISSLGIPIDRLCVKDHTGAPVYNQYQMYELGESLKAGVDVQKMFNPRMSDYEMAQMRTTILAQRGVQT